MLYYIVKVLVSALVIVVVSGLAALIAALPLTSLLAFVWMRIDGASDTAIAGLSGQIFWLVIPSLLLFATLWFLLRQGMMFWPELGAALGLTIVAYLALLPFMRKMGVSL